MLKYSMSKSKQKPISDDELLDQCIIESGQCHHTGCIKSIKLIKLDCRLCLHGFCPTHIQPEVHGCGGAARKEATLPPKKTPNPVKVAQLEQKMTKKLQQMKNERKKKGK